MNADTNHLTVWLDRFSRIAAVIAAAMGMLVLLGWLLGVDALKSIVPGLTFMKANTALGFILSGIALWDIQTGRQGARLLLVSRICAGLVLLVGLLTLGEYLTGVSFGIDQLLIQEITNLPGDIPGRMAVNTAVSFAALGAALLLLNKGGIAAVHALTLVPTVLASSALIGYGFDIEEFLRARLNYTPMALPTAAVFVLLAFGIVTVRPDYPLRRILTSRSAAGSTARRLLPASTGFAIAAGWVILQGLQAGHISDTLALALFAATSIAGGSAMILWNSGKLYEEAAQRELLEKSLRENEEQLDTIIRFLPVGLWILDAEGKVIFGNDTAQRIWAGVRYVGIEGLGEYKGWRVDSGKPVGPHEWAGTRAVEKGETSIEEEIEIECFDGTRKIILDSAVPLRRSDGSIRGAVTINQDITERKQAEKELRAASLYTRNLIEASLDPLVTISADGKITDVNEATVKVTGVPRKMLIGSDFSNYFTEPDRARASYQEVFAKGFISDFPLTLRHESGKQREVLYNASVYRDENGEVAGVFAAARDVTRRKKAEEEIHRLNAELEHRVAERTANLEAANKELEGFAYSVAHDLRVPLRAIDGFSHLVLKRHEERLDDEGKRLLNVVRDNTRRMGQLIDNMLDFTRMGRLEMRISEVDMSSLARTVFEELKPAAVGRDLTVEIRPLPPARGDHTMLHQVWSSLLSNAIKFTRPKPAARIEAGGTAGEAELVYYVKDNGVGFDPQYAHKLFEVSQRLHGVEEFEGTGINLKPWVDKGLLRFHAARPATYGLEMHLATVQRATEQFQPKVVVFDPISSFESAGSFLDARAMLMRLVDFLKTNQITSLFTSLTAGGSPSELTEVGISSLIDTWVLLRNLEQGGERTRLMYILKARGMAHSSQVREFILSNRGVDLAEVYLGPNGILTGSARAEQDMQDSAANLARGRDAERKRLVIEHKRKAMEARIAEIKAGFEIERREMEDAITEAEGAAQGQLARHIAAGQQREGISAAPHKTSKGDRK